MVGEYILESEFVFLGSEIVTTSSMSGRDQRPMLSCEANASQVSAMTFDELRCFSS